MRRPAVFLDRDGTLNVEVNYLHRITDLELIPGAAQAIRRLNGAGYLVVVVTNQAGIARGFFDAAAVHQLHAHLAAVLASHGARVDAFYFCPHHPEFTAACACRKPEPGMLLRAADEHAIDLSRSWLVGDTIGDLGAGDAAGCRTVLVRTGYGARTAAQLTPGIPAPEAVVADIGAAVEYILTVGCHNTEGRFDPQAGTSSTGTSQSSCPA